MNRKLTAIFLLSFLIVAFMATSIVIGADKPQKRFKDRASVPARFAPVYALPGLTGNEYTPPAPLPQRVSLRGNKSGEGIIEQVGSTTYGYQSNCTMGRQVEHRVGYSNPYTPYGHYIHFDWMAQESDTLGVGRGIGYQAYDITSCGIVFEAGGIRAESDYAGYVSIDAHNITRDSSWAVIGAHQLQEEDYISRSFWDFIGSGISVFGMFTEDHSNDFCGYYLPNCDGTNIWPKISWDIDGAEEVLHMVVSEFGGEAGDPQNCSYYRRVGPYGTGAGVWSNQRVIDTVMNVNVTVVSSPISDRVAIAWNAPVDYKRDTPDEFFSQYENDVWYTIATDNGADWAANPSSGGSPSIAHQVDIGVYAGGNITNYTAESNHKAYCDMSALFAVTTDAPGDELHITWGGRRWTDTTSLYRRQSAIFHWRELTGGIKTVVRAEWDTGGACYGPAWGSDAAKMTISECDNKLYICYTQFGDKDHPCNWESADNQVITGYLYMTVFDPGYDAWDRAQRVTDVTVSPDGCIPGDMNGAQECTSEYFASMARYGRIDTCKLVPHGNALDILYVNDVAPGSVVQDESGVWATNPVNWAVYPCREAVPEPLYADDAGPGYGLCVGEPIFQMNTTDDTTFVLMMENSGILANTPVSIDITGGSPNTTITATPNSGINIPPKGGQVPVDINVITVGETDNSTVTASIDVTYQVGNPPTPETRNIPLCITVSDSYIPLESAVLVTFCKKLKVYNNGQMSNDATNESMDFMDDEDDCANIYLYDGSPIICRDDAGTIRCYFTVYDNDYGSDHALRQISPMFYDSTSNLDYEYASAEFITGDSAIGMIVEYFAPKAEENCCFIIQKLKIFNRTETTLYGVAAGEVLDWDIPNYSSDSGTAPSDNSSGFDGTRNLVYQYTCYYDECDTLVDADRYGGIASYGAPFKNYMVIENDVFVYTTGPFEYEAPLPDDTTYGLMVGNDGPSTLQPDPCEDLTTLVTFGVYDIEPGDTICVIKILTTSKADPGGEQMKDNVDNANDFIGAHEEILCPVTDPCLADPAAIPGDANGDATINVGDAVYTINYVFKGGPPPTPYPILNGDGNGDCQTNVGDAVYTINYVFKGGPPPVTCQEWLVGCGPPLR